jgi:hypothetical protein
MKRWLMSAAVVLGLGVFTWATLGLLKDRQAAQRVLAKSIAVSAPSTAAIQPGPAARAAQSQPEPRGIGFGLTFAPLGDALPAVETIALGCHGEPKQFDRPHQGSCNPYQGDTSCRTVLPVLCLRPAGAGELMATEPVMGAVLQSPAAASARCEAEFGAGWRIAEFHDASGGQLQGRRGAGFRPHTRYWVHVDDQPGNCWDSAP